MGYQVSRPLLGDHVRVDHIDGPMRDDVEEAHHNAISLLERFDLYRLLVVIHARCVLPDEPSMVRFVSSVADRICGDISIAVVVLCEQTPSVVLLDVIARAHGLNHQVFSDESSATDWLSVQPRQYDVAVAINPAVGGAAKGVAVAASHPFRRRSDRG